MKKKLVTVAFSRTIEVDLPQSAENLSDSEVLDRLNDLDGSGFEEISIKILKQAADEIDCSWKSGDITDVQDL